MVGFTKEEKECPKCTGMMKGYCDGPEYLGGLCLCECHNRGNQTYEYNHGVPRKRIVASTGVHAPDEIGGEDKPERGQARAGHDEYWR